LDSDPQLFTQMRDLELFVEKRVRFYREHWTQSERI